MCPRASIFEIVSSAYGITTGPQTYPGKRPGADLHPKKVNNLDPMAPRSVKNVNYPRAPVVAVAVSLDPILPHR